ncbi:MLO-like protein 3 [Phoenix dactylifera]|uniref:MLO-like protein n=1 Tax=Phoenix dactylifera TaxID=42345 RepID=A0A8B7BR91_PHODC|nr:MLO-like protein 3 [Phoenix dactylifera]
MAVSLEHTPTWAFATIFFFTIFISYLLKRSIDFAGTWLKRRQKISLYDAVDKLKEELMILGLLSLILAVVQKPISYICIPTKAADFLLPCSKVHDKTNSSSSGHCAARGMVSLVSQQGVHQLHIFIFVLAVVHVLCGVVTMVLGRVKTRRWKAWEKETATTVYQIANDSRRFRFTRDTSFAIRHVNLWTTTSVYMWIRCFFRQFYVVDKVDYLTLRNGFILAHFSRRRTFNFQKYIKRALDDDFKTVIRISPFMWFLMVIFMLIDIHRWYSYFWLSFLPLVIVLSVGANLHMIVTKMALQLDKQRTVISGAPPVQPNDDLFWFGNPRLILFLLHLSFFQNAFELTFFIWIWYEFGLKSCYHENLGITIARVTIAMVVQFLSSYITLPLYALVSQMGSDFKPSMLEDRTREALRGWYEDVTRKRKKQHTCKNPSSFHMQDSRISMRTTT